MVHLCSVHNCYLCLNMILCGHAELQCVLKYVWYEPRKIMYSMYGSCYDMLHLNTIGMWVHAHPYFCGYLPSIPHIQDGTAVPVSLIYRSDLVKRDAPSPTLVHAYGCYGENLSMAYQPRNVSLLNRGWILAYCHTRGGGERGRKWYYAALREHKHRTVEDLQACVRHLHLAGYSTPSLTALYGRSAGGVAVGMFCNDSPELVQAAILKVPFVNVTGALSDALSYLGVKDHEEFGNSLCSEVGLRQVQSLCPYYNLKLGQNYPSMLIEASKRDPIIPINTVEQYVRRLKQCVSEQRRRSGVHSEWWQALSSIVRIGRDEGQQQLPRGSVFFSVDQHGSHYGEDQIAEQFIFLSKALGLPLS